MLQHEYIEANGVRLHVARSGQGKLMLFVHGFPEFWYTWRHQLHEFGRDHLAVAPDMRGYNLSSKPVDVSAYEVPNLVEDLRALAKTLGHERAIVVAHDWGGGVAWSLAARHPEFVEKLVILNSPHPAIFERELQNNPAQQAASQYILLFRTPKAEAALTANNYAALQEAMGLKRDLFSETDRQAYLAAWAQPGALAGSLNWYRAARLGPPTAAEPKARSFEASTAETQVRVPTLVIWGERDKALVKENLDGLDAYVPNLRIERIPDATHWLTHERPDLVNRHIRAFITI